MWRQSIRADVSSHAWTIQQQLSCLPTSTPPWTTNKQESISLRRVSDRNSLGFVVLSMPVCQSGFKRKIQKCFITFCIGHIIVVLFVNLSMLTYLINVFLFFFLRQTSRRFIVPTWWLVKRPSTWPRPKSSIAQRHLRVSIPSQRSPASPSSLLNLTHNDFTHR